MNVIEKWIFDNIDLQNPMRKHLRYLGNSLITKVKGYYLCHFITQEGKNWDEFLKPNKQGYIFNKYGELFDLEYDRASDTYHSIIR